MSDYIIYNGELYHHGILGQKWGVRRFQNSDGSLTSAGKKRRAGYQNKVSKLEGQLESNVAKKKKITDSYNKHAVQNARRDAAVNKLKVRRANMEKKVAKINTKINIKGKAPNFFEKRTLKKAYKLDRKIAIKSRPKLRYETKISKLNVQSEKIKKRIDRYNKKIDAINQIEINAGRDAVEKIIG